MAKPLVAVIGRPNVGKSTFFNRMAGRRIAIVDDMPGVTRDRLYADAQWLNHNFTIIDTAGIDPYSKEELLTQMRMQAELAIDVADVIIFMVDGKEGLTPMDEYVAQLLRRTKKPIVLVANKVDTPTNPDSYYDFYTLGFGEPFAMSGAHGLGTGDLLDEVVSHFDPHGEDEEEDVVKITIAGKPNAGKSSIVNKILKYDRSIVSDIAGTTRDAIDTPFEVGERSYRIIDTAGIRKKARIDTTSVERFSVIRSLTAVRRCNVVVIVIDANEGMTEQDVKIAGYAHEQGKASVIVVNKWDLVEKDTFTVEKFKKEIYNKLIFMTYAPIIYTSALTGQRINKIIETVDKVYEESKKRISTGLLNDWLSEAVSIAEPPSTNGRRLKIYFCTQVAIMPPTFVLFVNDISLMHFSYERYLENALRKSFGFNGTPIKIITRFKNDKE